MRRFALRFGVAVAAAVGATAVLAASASAEVYVPTPYEECLAQQPQQPAPAGIKDPKKGELLVCKTVKRTKVTRYTWTVKKTAAFVANGTGTLALPDTTGGSGTATWTITATPTATVTWDITGTIVVRNTGTEPVPAATITDTLFDSCGNKIDVLTQDAVIQPGDDNVFPYSVSLPASAAACDANGVNVANVTVDKVVTAGTEYPFAFVPDNQVIINRKAILSEDATVAGADTTVGPLSDPGPWEVTGDGDAASLTKTVTATVTRTVCGEGTVDNTARISGTGSIEFVGTKKEGYEAPPVTGQSSAKLTVNVPCTPPPPPPPPVTPPGTLSPPPPSAQPAGTPVAPSGVVTPARRTTKPKPRLAIDKRGPARATAGQVVVYTIAVRNTGGAAARGVSIVDDVPTQLSLTARTRGVSLSGGKLTWRVGNLARGQRVVRRVTMRIDASAAGQKCNTASASASNAARVSDTACTVVAPVASRVQPAVTG
mgnify:CR=1 FL=1